MNPNNLQAWSEDKTKQKGVDFVNLYREVWFLNDLKQSNLPQFAPMTAASLLALEDSFLNSPGPGSSLSRRSSGYYSPGESDNENLTDNADYTVNSNNEFVCGACGKGFQKLVGLRSHEVTHLEEKSELCRYCSKAFARRHDMFRHERTVHAQERLTTCLTCKNVYPDAESLILHCQAENHILPDAKPVAKKTKGKSIHKRTASAKKTAPYPTSLSMNQVQSQVYPQSQSFSGFGNTQPLTAQMQQMSLQQQQQQKMHMQQILHQQQQIQHAQQHARTPSWQATQGMNLDISPNLFTQASGNFGGLNPVGMQSLHGNMSNVQNIFQSLEPQQTFQNSPFAFLDTPATEPMPSTGYQINQQQLNQQNTSVPLNMNDSMGPLSSDVNPHSDREGQHRRLSSQSSLPPQLSIGNSQPPSLFQNDFGFTAQMNFGLDSTMFQSLSPGLGERFTFEDRYDSAMDGLVIHNEEPQLESFMPLPRFDKI